MRDEMMHVINDEPDKFAGGQAVNFDYRLSKSTMDFNSVAGMISAMLLVR